MAENSDKNNKAGHLKIYQFQPGQSGNPGGRPKKKPISEAYARLLQNPENADKLAKALFDMAVNEGSVFAAKEIADRLEGKAFQSLRLEGDLGIIAPEDRKKKVIEMLREGAQRIEGA